jgi:hypothetical protein
MFEIILKEDYEDHFMFREYEKAEIEAKNRWEFRKQMNLQRRKKLKQYAPQIKVDLVTGEQWTVSKRF